MIRSTILASCFFAAASLAPLGNHLIADETALAGYSAESSRTERQWEDKFRSLPSPANLRAYMQRLTARPHHVGSPYDKDNAEWILSKYKEFGLDAHIESFSVLFPTPKERLVELVEGGPHFVAKLQEPRVPQDPTSNQQSEQLPTYNAFSADGDVTGPLVYVNYGIPEDYETLARHGISVKGAIVIARYGHAWRGIKPKVAAEHGAVGCIIYSDPRDDGYSAGLTFPIGGLRPREGVQRGSVQDSTEFMGDPLTPNIGATPDAKRLDIKNAPTLTKIPVLPISYADAAPLMSAITGPVVPETWRGGLPITYRIGPGSAKVHLRVFSNWQMQPTLRRDRENSRLAVSRRMGATRQPSRRLGERRGRSHLRPGSGLGGGAFARRARESRMETQAHYHLLCLGWRRAWPAGFRGMVGDARGGTSPARRCLH